MERARTESDRAKELSWVRFVEWSRAQLRARHHRNFANELAGTDNRNFRDVLCGYIDSRIAGEWEQSASENELAPYGARLCGRRRASAIDIAARLPGLTLVPPWNSARTRRISIGALIAAAPNPVGAAARARLTAAHVTEVLEANAAAFAEIAGHPDIWITPREERFVVSHPASGFGAVFTVGEASIGWVHAKNYTAPRGTDWPGHWWRNVAGLGVGRRLYEQAAVWCPEVRWGGVGNSGYSDALRRKLHADDPWRWNARCGWCEQRADGWEGLDRAAFDSHPKHRRELA